MRVEVIRCDVCKKEHNTEYVLPSPWVVVKQNDGYGSWEENHFCSKQCLVMWAREIVEYTSSIGEEE